MPRGFCAPGHDTLVYHLPRITTCTLGRDHPQLHDDSLSASKTAEKMTICSSIKLDTPRMAAMVGVQLGRFDQRQVGVP